MNNDDDDCANFDIERMKSSIDSGFITIPHGLSREELREWLSRKADDIRAKELPDESQP